MRALAGVLAMGLVTAVFVGCVERATPRNLGMPCRLESEPPCLDYEMVVEGPSEACGGLVCAAYADLLCDGGGAFCTCRCSSLDGDPDVPLCQCGHGMHCVEDLVAIPGSSLAGGYCVPCITEDDDRYLNPRIFARCDE